MNINSSYSPQNIRADIYSLPESIRQTILARSASAIKSAEIEYQRQRFISKYGTDGINNVLIEEGGLNER